MRYINHAARLQDGTLKHQAAFAAAPAPVVRAVEQAAAITRELRLFDSGGTDLPLGPPLPPGVQISSRAAHAHHLLRTIWTHIISLIVAVPFGLDDSEREPTPAGAEALRLVEQLGPFTLGAMGADLRMLGNTMLIKDRGQAKADYLNDPVGASRNIQQLVYVSPLDVTTHVVDVAGRLVLNGYTVGGEVYTANRGGGAGYAPGGVADFPISGRGPGEYLPQDVVHIRGIPDRRYLNFYGLDLTPSALRLVQTDIEQTDYTQTTIHNAGTGPVIAPSKVGGDEVDVRDLRRFRDDIVRDVTGAQRGKPAVIPYGLEINPVGLSPRDMLLDSLYKLPETRLAALYGLSATMVGWLVGLENSPWSHLEQAREAEAEEVTTSVCKALAAGLTRELMLEYSPVDAFRFDVDSIRALQEDVDKATSRYVLLVDHGIITEQQAAERLGFEYQGASLGGMAMSDNSRDGRQRSAGAGGEITRADQQPRDPFWARAADLVFGPEAQDAPAGGDASSADATPAVEGATRFRATIARRDEVDKAGLLVQPAAFSEQEGKPLYLFRQHPQLRNDERVSLGAGFIRVTRDEAYVEGELHDTERAREFVREWEGLQRYGLGEASVGMGLVEGTPPRRAAQLTTYERQLGARAAIDQVRAFEVSFVDYGLLPNSTFDLVRSLDAGTLADVAGASDNQPEAPHEGRTAEQEAAIALFREQADGVDATLSRWQGEPQ